MAIIVDEKGLSGRHKYIRETLSCLNKKIAVDKIINADNIILFAKDCTSVDNHRTLFKTCNENIKANYFEIWDKTTLKEWSLNKLYFRAELKKNYSSYQEILSFHVDMLDNSNSIYKKFPHIHINHPTYDSITKAHIAFNLDNYSDVCVSLDKFNKNIYNIVEMVRNEIILRF